jgi:hypothetical protein
VFSEAIYRLEPLNLVKNDACYFMLEIDAFCAKRQDSFSKKSTAFLKFILRYLQIHLWSTIAILLIGFIGLLAFYWFRGNNLIAAGDFSMPLNRLRSFTANFYLWDSRALGASNPRILALTIPLWAYFAFSQYIGLSVISTEKILFYFLFTVSGLSMYYLTTTMLGKYKFKHLAGLISGLIYMLNPYVAIIIMPVRQISFMIYALLPLVLGIFIKGLNEKRQCKFAVIAAFVMLLATSVFVDPSFVPLTFLPLLIYLIFFVLTNPRLKALFSAVRFTTIFIVTWILFNLYWLIPDAYFSSSELSKVANAYSSVGVQAGVQLDSAPILGAFRLLGYWGLNSGYKGDPYFVWASAYQTSLLICVSFLLPFLAFILLLLKPKDKNVLFFAFFAIIGLFLVNGSYSPLGQWIFSSIPLFDVFFRTPYLRFGMYVTLAYAFLIGFALSEIFNILTPRLKKIRIRVRPVINGLPIVFLLFLIVGVFAFPLWTGDAIRPGTAVIPSARYQMPPYYQTASNWLGTDQSDFKILVLPISALGDAELKWANGGYNGPYPAGWLFPKAVITSSTDGNGIAGMAAQLIINNQTIAASKILALMNVKYVLFQNDTNWLYLENNTSWISTSPEQFQSILNKSNALTLEKTFGQLLFYKNNYWQPAQFYSASTSILSDGNLNELTQIEARNYFVPSNSIVVLSNQLVSSQISVLPMTAVFIRNFEKSQPFTAARYYSSWKGVISTNGTGDLGMVIFSSPRECPYLNAFPKSFTNWSSYDSTLIYIATGSSSLTVNSISADGEFVLSQAWWQTGASWITGWPITIPPNQNAVIQLNLQASKIILQTDDGPIALTVTNGWVNPLTNENPSEIPATIVVPNPDKYLLAINVTTGNNYGNLSVKVDNQFLDVNLYSQEPGTVFSYKYVGPIYLTAGPHTVTIIPKNGAPPQIDSMLFCSLNDTGYFVNVDNLFSSNPQNNTTLTYEQINPTKYNVYINSSKPFYLIFSDSYSSGWVATINGQQILDQYHFTVNGYANGWYINKTGAQTVVLEFMPQKLFYIGSGISITAFIICLIYLGKDKVPKFIKSKLLIT